MHAARRFPTLTPYCCRARLCAGTALLVAGGLLAGCGVTGGDAARTIASGSTAAARATPLGPQLGYVWRASDKTLRPILGVAGSAQIGASVTTAGTYATGAASSSGIGVLVAQDGSVYSLSLPGGQPVAANVTATPAASIRFAPTAGRALLFTPGASSIALLSGWPGTVAAQTLRPGLVVEDAALSDTGTVAFATPTSGGAAVYVVPASGAPQLVAHVSSLGGMSFLAGAEDLLVTDSTANTLVRVRSVLNSPSTTTVLAGGALNAPGAVSSSAGGTWAIVANTGAATVVRVNLAGPAAPLALSCACQPALLAPLAGGSAFRLTGLASGPLWLADAGPASPRVLFVPGLPVSQ